MHKNILRWTYKSIRSFLERHLPFAIKPNGRYKKRDVVDVLLRAEIENTTVESACRRLHGISSDDVFYHLGKMNLAEVLGCLSKGVEHSFLCARKRHRISGVVDIAIDVHEIAYYGKNDSAWFIGGRHKAGTSSFVKIISLCVVSHGRRYTLCVIPFHMFDLTVPLLERLVAAARRHVRIRFSFLDRGFLSVDVITKLHELAMKFVIPIKKNDKTVKLMDECARGGVGRVEYTMHSGKKQASFDLVIYEGKDDLVGFATSIPGKPARIAGLYRKRWGIETGYRVKNAFYGRTCSRKMAVRLMLIVLSFMLYNLWVTANRMLADRGESVTADDMCVMFVGFVESGIT